jgi:uncharacterized membrane protein YkoI
VLKVISNNNVKINKESAIQIALNKVPGKAIKEKMKFKNGKLLYEIDIETQSGEYEVHIDAATGEILKLKKEIE